MIPKENEEELDLISSRIIVNNPKLFDHRIVNDLMYEAMSDAVQQSNKTSDIKEIINYIITKYGNLSSLLEQVIDKEYPEQKEYLEKLLVIL